MYQVEQYSKQPLLYKRHQVQLMPVGVHHCLGKLRARCGLIGKHVCVCIAYGVEGFHRVEG